MTTAPLPHTVPPCPVDALLPQLLTTLDTAHRLVLSAPPGAGKTTHVPLALLTAPWRGDNKILMLEPRRLAAKAAARHMARLLGEHVGRRVGYAMRLERCAGPETRIEVVTEGVLTRMLQADPELAGIACIIFDEFHERSLHADTGLALCLECQEAFRPDLRLLVMSATLETEALTALLDGCPALVSEGRAYDVELRYLPPPRQTRMEEHMAKVIRHALRTEQGSILAFLPGVGEIRRVQALLEQEIPADVRVLPLYGMLPPAAQDAAITPALPPERKVVLATALAETSLTIEGVRIVIDSGLARTARYDTGAGMSRLVTTRVALAQAKQRAGRAGRTESGLCFRLWAQAEEVNFAAFPRPEISEADLCPLLLQLAAWGVTDARSLRWLTPPPESALRLAAQTLRALHALDAKNALTPVGTAMLRLPVHPRLAGMLLAARTHGVEEDACALAALLEERDVLPRADSDIRRRVQLLHSGDSPAVKRLRQSARQLRRLLARHGGAENTSLPCRPAPAPETNNREQCPHPVAQAAHTAQRVPLPEVEDSGQTGALLALAWPEWVGQLCGEGQYRLRCGRMAFLPVEDSLARTPFLAVAALNGEAARSRIFLAAPLTQAQVEQLFADDITQTDSVAWDARGGMVQARRQTCLGALLLEDAPLPCPTPEARCAAMLEGVRALGLEALPWTEDLRQWQARVQLLHSLSPEVWPDVSAAALLGTVETWLAPFLVGISRASQLRTVDLAAALHALLPWNMARQLDRLAPARITVPSGSSVKIDYTAAHGPVLAVKLQEVFGWEDSPVIAEGRVKLCLHLNSPAGRPLQVTQDLRHFWQNAYAAVRGEMRGRYPKHPWPEDPLTAMPTRFTTKRLAAEAQKKS